MPDTLTGDPLVSEPDTPGIDSLEREGRPVKHVPLVGTCDREPREMSPTREALPTGAGRDPDDESTRLQGDAARPAPDPIAARSMAIGRDAVARSADGTHRQPGGPLRVPAVRAEDIALWFG